MEIKLRDTIVTLSSTLVEKEKKVRKQMRGSGEAKEARGGESVGS